MRAACAGFGLIIAGYGGWQLLDLGIGNLWHTVVWALAAVIVHDALLGFALIGIGAGVVRIPGRARAAVAVGMVFVGTVTATAIPVLSGAGRRADNATLLDRPYWWGWLGLVGLGAALAGSVAWLAARTADPRRLDGSAPRAGSGEDGTNGADPGRR